MRAVVYDGFGLAPEVREVAEPVAPPGGVVIRVEATGLCRSDWHGWQGHDADIQKFPHVPGHEFSGIVAETGAGVRNWTPGDRVMTPFVCACGTCPDCARGDHQVCANQTQPGFTHWGSFAGHVAIDHADVNLIRLPEQMSFATAAGLGCRFATAFRAVADRASVRPGEWVAVWGCGGVGLSAVMIAAAAGARVVAIDTAPEALALARRFGAAETLLADGSGLTGRIRDLTSGGAHVSMDALGDPGVCAASILCLRRRGRHVQIGLLPQGAELPMGRVIAYELDLLGSHGMPAHAYPRMLELIASGALAPEALITRTISLDAAVPALTGGSGPGVTMIDPWLHSEA
ncbi:alcohol dehydrogenase [Acrocarpospora phusangensis]|uniref:Alcohol dehydrogenase n=1 Tax=Acrocarpospora phusangensis TaxID=1070424 RepID=A0A919QD35_9ACTN|nr:zinc-dependent alcohol dehydrogenase family protein [Acrocarpospora phusangensis]GIH26498.1 alcohol dehydrogenase [Acrocarpospora phusangensis]